MIPSSYDSMKDRLLKATSLQLKSFNYVENHLSDLMDEFHASDDHLSKETIVDAYIIVNESKTLVLEILKILESKSSELRHNKRHFEAL